MMSSCLKFVGMGFKMASGVMVVATAIEASDFVTCFVGGSLSVFPLAWLIAGHMAPD